MNKFPGFSFEKIKENGIVKIILSCKMKVKVHKTRLVKQSKWQSNSVKIQKRSAKLVLLLCLVICFWTSGYNWIRRKDEQTKLEGHSSHEVLVQVFIMSMQLKKLENGRWKNECVTLCSLLSKNPPSPGE